MRKSRHEWDHTRKICVNCGERMLTLMATAYCPSLKPMTKHMIDEYTEKRPVVIPGYPDAHTVWLKVGVQSFCITPDYAEDDEHAEWLRKMLGKALVALVEEQP